MPRAAVTWLRAACSAMVKLARSGSAPADSAAAVMAIRITW